MWSPSSARAVGRASARWQWLGLFAAPSVHRSVRLVVCAGVRSDGQATSGINGAGSRTQAKMGLEDSYETFLEDTVRSATGVKTGPMPEPYPLAEVLAGGSAAAVHWIQDDFGLALDTVSRLGGHSQRRTHRSMSGGKFPGMEITSALMRRYEELADAGDCDLVINASAKRLLKDAYGRVTGVEYIHPGLASWDGAI